METLSHLKKLIALIQTDESRLVVPTLTFEWIHYGGDDPVLDFLGASNYVYSSESTPQFTKDGDVSNYCRCARITF